MDKEQLIKDRDNFMKLLQENAVQRERILGAISYINGNLTENKEVKEDNLPKET